MNPRFIVKFIEPAEPEPQTVEIVREAIRNGTFILLGDITLDILDLESNRIWHINRDGISESHKVNLIGDFR